MIWIITALATVLSGFLLLGELAMRTFPAWHWNKVVFVLAMLFVILMTWSERRGQ